jgi:hypothetical protein
MGGVPDLFNVDINFQTGTGTSSPNTRERQFNKGLS